MNTCTDELNTNPDKFLTLNPRRKLRNSLLRPSLQLKFPIVAILFAIFFAASIALTLYLAFGELYHGVMAQSDLAIYYRNAIKEQMEASIGMLGALSLANVVLIIVFSIGFTHRMVGPQVAFLRQIKKLKEGSYSSRIRLRKGDAFEDIALALNELSEILEHKSPKQPSQN